VMPFLERVTRGRGIPRERLEAVSHHYLALGGVSPINAQNRQLLGALRTELDARGIDLPLFWGNRNSEPYIAETLRDIHAAGPFDRPGRYDERLLLVFQLPAVPRGPGRRPGVGGPCRADPDREGPSLLRPPGLP